MAPRPLLQKSNFRRQLPRTLAVAVAFGVVLGILLAGIQFASVQTPLARWPRALAIWTLVALGWIPFIVLVGFLWDRLTSRALLATALIATGAIAAGLQPLWLIAVVSAVGSRHGPYAEILVAWLDTNVILSVGIAGAWWAVNQWTRADLAARQYLLLRTSVEDARLQILTLQLQPHFIFNTLNLVSELAYRDTPAALATLSDLRSLLTESLRHTFHRETTLGTELEFLNSYLAIQHRRFRDRLKVAIHADKSLLGAAVPHLVLQPLVENAIVHGLTSLSRGGTVTVDARRSHDRLIVTVSDDGAGFAESLNRERLGLTNTRLRLEQLYPDNHQLSVKSKPGKGTVSTIVIPYKEAATTTNQTVDPEDSPPMLIAPPMPAISSRLLVAGVWLLVAALWTQIDSISRMMGSPRPGFQATVWVNLAGAAMWLALTPFVVWLSRRADLTAGWSVRRVALHILGAASVGTAHVMAWIAVSNAIVGTADHTIQRDALPWLTWNLFAYFAIVAFASVASLAERRRERLTAAAETDADLRIARTSALRLRLQPQMIIEGLDQLSAAVKDDPRRAETAIARMGDLLRTLLDSADDQRVLTAVVA